MLTYVLLHVLLSHVDALSCETHGHFGGGILHEATKCWVHVVVSSTSCCSGLRILRLAAISITVLRRGRWWATELRYGRDVLRHGVVERWALRRRHGGVCRALHVGRFSRMGWDECSRRRQLQRSVEDLVKRVCWNRGEHVIVSI